MRLWLCIVVMSCCAAMAEAQPAARHFGVAYYDVDRLYDTIPSRFYDDGDYTPQGRLRWDSQRYRRKVEQTARVIDSMGMDVVALYGVENEAVVRDLVEACEGDYAYIHRTSDDYRGLDFALLYFGDRFFPERVTPWRGALCVEGEAGGRPIAIVANHRSESVGVLLAERGLLGEGCEVILLGECNRLDFERFGLVDLTARAEAAGRGTRWQRGRWQMRDRVAANVARPMLCDVFVRGWMLSSEGCPLPTFENRKYYGGYGRNLPVFIYFDE